MNLADPHQRTIDAREEEILCARGSWWAQRERKGERGREKKRKKREKKWIRCLNHVEGNRYQCGLFPLREPSGWLGAVRCVCARIGTHEQGEINSPVLILTDSTTKWLVAWFHQSARVITGVPRFVRSLELERVRASRCVARRTPAEIYGSQNHVGRLIL